MSSFAYYSNKKKSVNKANKLKKEWDSNQTDPNIYKLTEKQILLKKQLLISKHNILNSNNTANSTSNSIKKKRNHVNRSNLSKISTIDLLDQDDELMSNHSLKSNEFTNDTPISIKNNQSINTIVKSLKKSNDNLNSTPSSTSTRGSSNRLTNTPSADKTVKKYTNKPSNKSINDMNKNDDDIIEMYQLIQSLQKELRYYEEVAGIKSIFDSNELEELLQNENNHTDVKNVLRYLIQLVCQTMSYLLKSEIEKHKQQNLIDNLSSKVDSLTNKLSTSSINTPSTIYNHANTPPESINQSIVNKEIIRNESIVTPMSSNQINSSNTIDRIGTSTSDWLLTYTTNQFDQSVNQSDRHIRRQIPLTETIPISSPDRTANSNRSTTNNTHDEDTIHIYSYLLNTDYMSNLKSESNNQLNISNSYIDNSNNNYNHNEYIDRLSATNITSPVNKKNINTANRLSASNINTAISYDNDNYVVNKARIDIPNPTQPPRHPYSK